MSDSRARGAPVRSALALLTLLAGTVLPLRVADAAPANTATITYAVGTAGHTSTNVTAFANHIARTLAEPAGWSLGGSIRFARVANNPSMRILITAPAVLGGIPGCSSTWSCRVGTNVYINETRWNQATPTWTLGLDAYRHYVINHEVGHFLGLGHAGCPGAGRPAPVMMQQSKGAAPCVNNVWPLNSERQSVARRYGVPVLVASAASSRYVGTAYARILQRWPSPLEAHLYGIALDRGGLTRGGLLDRLFTSAEFQQVPATVVRLYASAFARRPDVGEVQYWGSKIQNGYPPRAVATGFTGSAEFAQLYGNRDTGAFIEALYANVLGRQPDPAGRQYWVQQIDSGSMTQGEVLFGFSESPEHRMRTRSDVLVQVAYLAILDRPVDPAGSTYWTGRLDAGMPLLDVVNLLRTQSRTGL